MGWGARYQIWSELEVPSGAAAELDKNCTCILLRGTNDKRSTSRKQRCMGVYKSVTETRQGGKQATRHVCTKREGGGGGQSIRRSSTLRLP